VRGGGLLYSVAYTLGTASAFATGANFTLSRIGPSGLGSAVICSWGSATAPSEKFPRFEGHTSAGATAASGTYANQMPLAAGDILRLTVASGGASGNGWFDFYVDGSL
jgi:hypothetical protein